MSPKLKDRHLFGAGAAACAICCAPPLLAILGIAGAGLAATIATVAFAGLSFGLVVVVGSFLALWGRRRPRADACATDGPVEGPVDVTMGARPTDAPQEPQGSR